MRSPSVGIWTSFIFYAYHIHSQYGNEQYSSVSLRGISTILTSVCLSVCHKSCHTSRHQFFLIFCVKLAHYERFKVTKPDFRKKNYLAQKWAIQGQKGAKMRFQAIFSFKMHQILPILHIMIENNSIQYLIKVKALKKNLLALKWANQGQKGAKMRFQAIFSLKMRQFSAILHIMIENNDIYHLMIVKVLKIFLLALKRAHFGPN